MSKAPVLGWDERKRVDRFFPFWPLCTHLGSATNSYLVALPSTGFHGSQAAITKEGRGQMTNRQRSRSIVSVSLKCAVAMSAVALATSAFAQVPEPVRSPDEAQAVETGADQQQGTTSTPDEDEIVITGTFLRGVAPTGTNVLTMSDQDVAATGAISTNQVLARIPQITNAFNRTPAIPPVGPALSVVTPNLRNLPSAGGTTTLILIDGHRTVNVGILQTSPDPDVIPPGVLERVEIVPDGGSSIYGSDAVGGVINFITRKRFDGFEAAARYGFADDYYAFDFNLTAGKDWGSGSAYVSYSFAKNDAIFGRDRDYVRQITADTGFCAPGTIFIDRAGVVTTYALPGRVPGTQSSCDATDDRTIYPAVKRHSVFVGLTQDLSDSIELDIRGFYTRRETVNRLDLNATGFTSFAQEGTITPANPYYVPIAPDTGVQRVRFSYAGVFDDRQTNDLDEFGVTPSLTIDLDSNWNLRLLGNYGRSKTEAHSPRIDAAAQGAALAGTTVATALNPYDPGATAPAVLRSIFADDFGQATQELINARAILDGSLLNISGGDVRVAVGAEFIRETFKPLVLGVSLSAHRTVKSVFGEVIVPIVGSANGTGGINELTLSGSARYDHYSDFGSTFNPKVGVTYRPVSWIAVRGNFGTSFNAPSLADAKGAVDTRAQIIPVSPFLDPADPFFPNFFRPTVLLAGGNPDLGPQKAKTWSLGTDISPPFIDGLKVSVTYYNIKLKDQIRIFPFFTPAGFNPTFSAFFIKNPTLDQLSAAVGDLPLEGATTLASLYPPGPYVLFDARRQNLGRVNQDGIDFNVSYRRETGFGSVNAGIGGTYTLHRKVAVLPGDPFLNELKTPGDSRFSFVASAGVKVGNLSGQATLSHLGGYDVNPPVVTPALTQTHVKSFNTVDLFFNYDVGGEGLLEDLSFTLNINNIFDQDPPFSNRDPGFTNGATLGRLVQFGVRKKF